MAGILAQNGAHLVRAPLSKARPKTLGASSCYLLLWVQNDQLRFHTPQERWVLSEGELLFIRPRDRYALQGRGAAPLVVAVAFSPQVITPLGNRHDRLRNALFWSDSALPARSQLDMRALAALNHQALRLEHAASSPLDAEAFLLPLCAQLVAPRPDLPPDTPDWLAEACLRAREPDIFRKGAAGFVQVSGRAHSHVSRTAQKFLGQSPTEYVNVLRMDHAARRLVGSADGLREIAEECGITNLSHFHKLFRAQFGQSPARFRRANQTDLLNPRT